MEGHGLRQAKASFPGALNEQFEKVRTAFFAIVQLKESHRFILQ